MSEDGARDGLLSLVLIASLTCADADEIVLLPTALFLGDLTELGSRACTGTSLSLLLSLILLETLVLFPF